MVFFEGPVLIPRRILPGTWPVMGATVPLAVGRQASVMDRLAPTMSRAEAPPTVEGGRPIP